jgi:predicted NACHT family NTPase
MVDLSLDRLRFFVDKSAKLQVFREHWSKPTFQNFSQSKADNAPLRLVESLESCGLLKVLPKNLQFSSLICKTT